MLLSISWTLPPGFGYILNEVSASIVVDVADDWNNRGQLRLSQTSPALADFDYRIPIDFLSYSQDGVTTGVRATKINGTMPRTPILPRDLSVGQGLSFTNTNAAVGAAGTIDAVISFWEYDLQQLQYFPVHVAEGVYNR